MSEQNPMAGRPYGGVDRKPDDTERPPGERPLSEDEQYRTAPQPPDDATEWSTRAAQEPMPAAEEETGPSP
ncbi:MAG: hypothetical protein M3P83_08835, partial [Actinomycetota bacterium]|nr:hypothetical protein [Actinomycetota bacterium]